MEYIKLKDVCDLKNGYAFKSSDYVEKSEVLNCRMSNIRPNATFDAEYSPKYLPNDYAEKYKEYLLDDGDLIIAMTDLANDPKILGVPTIVDTKGYKMLLNQRVGKLLLLNERPIKKKYLKYALSVPQNRGYFKKFAGGGVQINIGKAEILNIDIPYCDVEIQNKIVEVLDKAQSLIDKKKEQIELLDELVKSRFVDMFGDPNCNNKNWKIKKFKDVSINKDSDRVPIKQSDREKRSGKYPYYGATGIIDGIDGYIFDGLYLLIAEDGKNLETKNKDIAFLAYGKFWVNNHAHVIKETNETNLYYLKYVINNINLKPYITGIDQLKLNRGNLDNIELPIPPIELQNEFAEFVTQTDSIRSKMETSLSELEDNFNSLMQKAFKGELFKNHEKNLQKQKTILTESYNV